MAGKRKGAPKKKTAAGKTAVKKTAPSKKNTARKKRAPRSSSGFTKAVAGLAVLAAICLLLAVVADMAFKPDRSKKRERPETADSVKKPVQTRPGQPQPPESQTPNDRTGSREDQEGITYEVYHDVEPVLKDRPSRLSTDKRPEIAIIIDDIGYDRKTALALFELDPDITFSILPFSPFGRSLAEKLHRQGAQVMLHLPMEPRQYPDVNPGPGAILSAMTPDELLGQLKRDISDIPYIVGVNNHMGSELTTRADRMNQIFSILRRHDFFFIDSKTAVDSKGRSSARLLRVKFAERDVFLDNIQTHDYIAGQLSELVRLAEKHGAAIGIGHPYPATLQTLKAELPKFKKRVRVVRADTLTGIPK